MLWLVLKMQERTQMQSLPVWRKTQFHTKWVVLGGTVAVSALRGKTGFYDSLATGRDQYSI